MMGILTTADVLARCCRGRTSKHQKGFALAAARGVSISCVAPGPCATPTLGGRCAFCPTQCDAAAVDEAASHDRSFSSVPHLRRVYFRKYSTSPVPSVGSMITGLRVRWGRTNLWAPDFTEHCRDMASSILKQTGSSSTLICRALPQLMIPEFFCPGLRRSVA